MRRRHLPLAGLVLGLTALTALACAPAASAHAAYPVAPNIAAGIATALVSPASSPPGANEPSCVPSQEHPYPVVLVPGTFSSMADDFAALAPTLANQDYCVYSFDYGDPPGDFVQATGPLATSGQELATFVAAVRAETGASRVDLVGHSQGGTLAEYYAKSLGGAPHVHDLIALGPTTHGTTLDGLTVLAAVFPGANDLVGAACPACADQENGSAFVTALDTGPIAQPGVTYTVIDTIYETVVTPVGSSFIHEPGVTDEYVQAQCPNDLVDHVDLAYDTVVFQDIDNALDPARAHAPDCLLAYPVPA